MEIRARYRPDRGVRARRDRRRLRLRLLARQRRRPRASATAYRVRFEGSVSGLLLGSAVLFNGIRVGEVSGRDALRGRPRPGARDASPSMRGTPVRADTHVGMDRGPDRHGDGGAHRRFAGGARPRRARTASRRCWSPIRASSQDWARARARRSSDSTNPGGERRAAEETPSPTSTRSPGRSRENSDKVDSILAGLERMTGGGKGRADIPTLRSLSPASGFPRAAC